MYHPILRVLKRYHSQKIISGVQIDLRSNGSNLYILRHKVQVAMLDEEKFTEMEMIQPEISSLSWFHKVSPGFPVNGSKITIIHEPTAFYSALLEKCRVARKRITLASLYLGTGKLEENLITAVEECLRESNGKVEVNILLDYMRGSRGKQNSRRMLAPLLAGKWKSCNVFLYHTPKLRGFLKALIPARFNELVGLQHMKLYLFDDTLIISGANLSNDYFTNRQDRYFMIEDCKELCNFYEDLVKRVSEFSFRLLPDDSTEYCPKLNAHPLKSSKKDFTYVAANRIRTLFRDEMEKRSEQHTSRDAISDADTWIFPLVEMGQLNIHHDSEVTLRLLRTAPTGSTLRLATGYFNLTSEYRNALLCYCRATCHLLTAHPTANGFFGAKGVASGIPAAYTKIEESFCKMCEKLGQDDRVTLYEFTRPGWTYHAKGLWYSMPGQQKPCLTFVGSPNFGYRSVKRDLETQIAVVTKNEGLQNALQEEYERLFSCAHPVSRKSFSREERYAPAWVRAAVIFFRYYF